MSPLPTTTHPPGFRYVRAWVGANATLLVSGQYLYGGAVPIAAWGAPMRSLSPLKNPAWWRGWVGWCWCGYAAAVRPVNPLNFRQA
jgi:hypothetical protein